MIKEKIRTDLNYFNEKGEKVLLKNCLLLNNFYFSRNDFFLLDIGGAYNVCVSRDEELITIWKCEKEGLSASEVMSKFRKGYADNDINTEKIEKFLKKPKKYGKKQKVGK